jgi:AP-1-like factor
MTVELGEYKKRVSLLSGKPVQRGPPFGSLFVNNLNDVNFQFEFPKFGSLPGPPVDNTKKPSAAPSQPSKQASIDHRSPGDNSQDGISPTQGNGYNQFGLHSQPSHDQASLSGLFTSPLTNGRGTNGSTMSMDSQYNMGGATSTSSPSASSNSNMTGPSSSCGTSPEPFTQSPMGFKPLDTLSTIGEENPNLSNQTPGERICRNDQTHEILLLTWR